MTERSQLPRARGRGQTARRRRAAAGTLLCLALLCAGGAAALPEDRLKAIEITAERAERHERGGYTIYSGAVVLQQGSLHIEADRLTIFHDREAADRIVAVGAPARMRQQPAIDKGPVHASAMRIVYEKSREVVTLKDTASIEQDGAVVTGESIEYFMAEQRVRADSSSADKNARVQVFIPADVVSEQAGAAPAADDDEAAAEDPAAGSTPAAGTETKREGDGNARRP